MDWYPIQRDIHTPSRFILQKPELSAGTDEPLSCRITIGTDFTFYLCITQSLFLNALRIGYLQNDMSIVFSNTPLSCECSIEKSRIGSVW